MGSVTNMRAKEEEDTLVVRASCIAPRPKTIAETGFTTAFLSDLLEKHLFEAGALTLGAMIKRTALAGPILEEILNFLRREGRVEIRTRTTDEHGLRYALTDRGRLSAEAALTRSGYTGPAPVPLSSMPLRRV